MKLNTELIYVRCHLLDLTFNCCLGRHGGTPLHHAAKRGFESIIKLLLMHGGMVNNQQCMITFVHLNSRNLSIWALPINFAANPLILNDDCLTALEVARAKGHGGAVRTIEV